MKRKIITGLMIAVLTLAFTACKNPASSEVDKGSAPIIKEAIFIQVPDADLSDLNNKTLDYIRDNYKITSLGLKDTKDYYLAVIVEDADHDFDSIEINANSDFTGMGWEWHNVSEYYEDSEYSNTNTIPGIFKCGFRTMLNDEEKASIVQTNKPIFVRAGDKKENVSTVYEIPGISLTLETSSH